MEKIPRTKLFLGYLLSNTPAPVETQEPPCAKTLLNHKRLWHNGGSCVTNSTIPQTVRFPDLFDKPLVATFDREQASSDGGAVLLKAAERVYGLVKAFARCLVDKRAPEKIRHTLEDLVGQRVFGIACGHPDGNDADHLADDPIHKLLLGRDPVAGGRLASQPTISRFENDAGRSALYRMGRELAASVIERHRRRLGGRARRITIDLDPTDDRTHGAQQLTFFNGHYDSWCYLPLLAFVRFDHEVEQYLCAAVLRPGKAVAADGTLGVLSRLLPLLRCAFPRARFLVLGRPQSSWTRIKGESDVTRRWGYGSVEAGEGSWVGADGGSPEGDRSRRRRGGDGVGGLGAGTTVEREPETGCGVAAAA